MSQISFQGSTIEPLVDFDRDGLSGWSKGKFFGDLYTKGIHLEEEDTGLSLQNNLAAQ